MIAEPFFYKRRAPAVCTNKSDKTLTTCCFRALLIPLPSRHTAPFHPWMKKASKFTFKQKSKRRLSNKNNKRQQHREALEVISRNYIFEFIRSGAPACDLLFGSLCDGAITDPRQTSTRHDKAYTGNH